MRTSAQTKADALERQLAGVKRELELKSADALENRKMVILLEGRVAELV